MTFNEIKELKELGFSPEQITELAKTPTPDPVKTTDPDPVKTTDPAPTPDPVKTTDPEVSKLSETVSALSGKFDELVQQMQRNNLKFATVDILPSDTDKSAESALSELIRPSIKKEETK